jgi:hypothetical protein
MFGSTLALMGAFDETEQRSRDDGFHCERGCVFCHEFAIKMFEYWLIRQRPTAKLAATGWGSPELYRLDLWGRVRPNFNAPYQPISLGHGELTPMMHVAQPCLRCVHQVRNGALRVHVQAKEFDFSGIHYTYAEQGLL